MINSKLDLNIEYSNSGNNNLGGRNSGDSNIGSRNSGSRNSGHLNSGHLNSGSRNSGHCNLGGSNSGDHNSGFRNSGNFNSGNFNSGDHNSGSYNTGYCNSITPEDCLIFNKPAKRADWENAKKPRWMQVALTKWVEKENMTKKDKELCPGYAISGGIFVEYDTLQSAYEEAWDNTTQEDRELTYQLPNFDPVVFEEVFGFKP